jgi:hypothetical protein
MVTINYASYRDINMKLKETGGVISDVSFSHKNDFSWNDTLPLYSPF